MQHYSVPFQRTMFNALLLVRNGVNRRGELARRLDLAPASAVLVVEALLAEGYVYRLDSNRIPSGVAVTQAGIRAIAHIKLAANGRDQVLRRWRPSDPDGAEAA